MGTITVVRRLAFWLAFVPNVGMGITVCLPMPLVLLEPSMTPAGIALAFLGPLFVGLVAKDGVEPLLIGHSTSLTPVAVGLPTSYLPPYFLPTRRR